MPTTNLGNVRGPRGFSGSFPRVDSPYSAAVEVSANTEVHIATLTGAIEITLGAAQTGYSSEWVFVLSQGEIARDVVLPEIAWSLGIAPTFASNSTTEVRLWYVGEVLSGVWFDA